MTITQTVEVPADRRIIFEVPPQIPIGKVQVFVTPVEELLKTEISLSSLRGSCKGLDTLDAYFARKRADIAVATAKCLGATLVTKDKELKVVEDAGELSMLWL